METQALSSRWMSISTPAASQTQLYALLADEVADTEIRAAHRRRQRR